VYKRQQYERAMGENPSGFTGDPQRPVDQVSWENAIEFCKRLSQQEGKTYRLPTEAEWEYACRAGSGTRFCFGDDELGLGDYAWYDSNSANTAHPAGQDKANKWGFCDMHGNVFEWCADWYDESYYATSPPVDPCGPSSGVSRVLRGGSWSGNPRSTRSAIRGRGTPRAYWYDIGFRVARTP